jgi:hypothetical protein
MPFVIGVLGSCGTLEPAAGAGTIGSESSTESSGVSQASTGGPASEDDTAGSSLGPEADTSAGEVTGDTGTSGGETGVPGAWCVPIPDCAAPLPNPGPEIPWEQGESSLVVASGAPNHRGRDMFYGEGDPQWVLGKLAYGPTDWDLEGERVDLFLLRDCTGDWESLGTTTTTFEGTHPTVEGVADTGGRVYLQIPEAQRLGLGRHRVHMVARGDLSRADMYIEVVPPGTPIFVADIDGTLTTSETEEYGALLTGTTPEVNPGAPQVLSLLAERGYHPVYVTARPEFLGARTHEFIRERGLPAGIVHTTLNFDGALGDAAVEYKTGELAALAARGLHPDWVFGNTGSDAQAYENAGILPKDRRIFFQFEDALGGRTIQAYGELAAEVGALPDLCVE